MCRCLFLARAVSGTSASCCSQTVPVSVPTLRLSPHTHPCGPPLNHNSRPSLLHKYSQTAANRQEMKTYLDISGPGQPSAGACSSCLAVSSLAKQHRLLSLLFTNFYEQCLFLTAARPPSVHPSVCLSVCLSVLQRGFSAISPKPAAGT